MSNISVAGPVWGGIATMTPSAGSRPASTKQKTAPVFTPVPRVSGQRTFAGSVTSGAGGGGLRAAGRRRCACASATSTSEQTNTNTPALRMIEV
jgi:hypothetical protein